MIVYASQLKISSEICTAGPYGVQPHVRFGHTVAMVIRACRLGELLLGFVKGLKEYGDRLFVGLLCPVAG